jgi:hypothetical protein
MTFSFELAPPTVWMAYAAVLVVSFIASRGKYGGFTTKLFRTSPSTLGRPVETYWNDRKARTELRPSSQRSVDGRGLGSVERKFAVAFAFVKPDAREVIIRNAMIKHGVSRTEAMKIALDDLYRDRS